MGRLISGVAAGVLALALAAAPAMAQEQTAEAVMDGMAALGIDVEGLVLTEEQVLEVEAVLAGGGDDRAKKAEIEALLAE